MVKKKKKSTQQKGRPSNFLQIRVWSLQLFRTVQNCSQLFSVVLKDLCLVKVGDYGNERATSCLDVEIELEDLKKIEQQFSNFLSVNSWGQREMIPSYPLLHFTM